MKTPQFAALFVPFGALLSLTACNNPSSVSEGEIAAGEINTARVSTAISPVAPATSKDSAADPLAVRFGESITGVSFSYDSTSQIADLEFRYDDGEKDAVGYSVLKSAELRGKAAKGEWAPLDLIHGADFKARVLCADPSCSYAQIELSDSGSRIAKINSTVLHETQSAVAFGTIPADPTEVMGSLAKELSGVDHRDVSLAIQEIVGASTYFEIRFNLGDKEGIASGKVGTSENVELSYYAQEENVINGGAAPYPADVTYDPSHSLIGIKFKSGAIVSIGAGAELFSELPST